MGGGDMIGTVSFERSTWAEIPHKFEAGTPPILEAIGLGTAIDYVAGDRLRRHRRARGRAGRARRWRGWPRCRACACSGRRRTAAACSPSPWRARTPMTWRRCWTGYGIAVRAGNHCAEPLMRRLGVDSSARASFGIYTTTDEIDALADTLQRVREFLLDVRRGPRALQRGNPPARAPPAHAGRLADARRLGAGR